MGVGKVGAMMNLERSIVLVGFGPEIPPGASPDLVKIAGNAVTATEGTGVLLQYKGKPYVVTCRHVVEAIPPGEILKVITADSPYLLYLKDPTIEVHADDSPVQTADFAIVTLASSLLQKLPFIPFNGLTSLPKLTPGMEVRVYGYPIAAKPGPRLVRVDALAYIAEQVLDRTSMKRKIAFQQHARPYEVGNFSGMSGGLVTVNFMGREVPFGIFNSDTNGHSDGKKATLLNFISLADVFESKHQRF